MRRTSCFAGVAAVLVTLAAAGCESDVDSRLALVGLGDACHLNSDCDALLLCVFERCHEACNDSRDCDSGAHCVRGARQRNVCQLEDEQSCSQHAPCPGSQLCAVDATCRDACLESEDCIAGQVCTTSTCADATEVDAEGLLPVAASESACTYDSDCSAGRVCRGGECQIECRVTRDCATAHVCNDGVCEPLPAATPVCLRPSDCKESQGCVDGECVDSPPEPTLDCRYSSDCTVTGQHCDQGTCVCECKIKADCGADEDCWNGCACRSTRKIVGDVIINGEIQLRELDNVDEIDGKLTLYLQSTGSFRVPGVRLAKSVLVDGHEVSPTVVFEALERVTETFQCDQACFAPRLASAGSITLHSLNMHEFSLPALASVTTRFDAFDNPRLGVISFPALTSAPELDVHDNPQLGALDLRRLDSVTGALKLTNNSKLETVNLSRLKQAGSLELSKLPWLSALSLEGLKQTDEEDAAMPQVGAVLIDATGLTTIEPLHLAYALTATAPLTVTFNRALPSVGIEALYDQLKARSPEWKGDYFQYGNGK
jgi:hypothetical protein